MLIGTTTYLVHIWPNQIIKFVEDTIDDFHQKMALLVLQGRRHQQWQDLVKERSCAKLSGLICDLTKSSLKGDRLVRDSFSKIVTIKSWR